MIGIFDAVGRGASSFGLRIGQKDAVLHADGTIWLPDERMLLVADLHLGKGSSFRARRVPVPTGATAATLRKLTVAIDRETPATVAILGDLWHARDGCTPEVIGEFERWLEEYRTVEFCLVIGNHDRKSGLPKVSNLAMDECLTVGDLRLRHEPEPGQEGTHVVAGHLHPGCTVTGRGGQTFRLPCFWSQPSVTVLPAFGEMTGLAMISSGEGDTVIALAQGSLIDVSLAVRS